MKWNNVLKSLLKTTVYILDQATDQVDRAAETAAELRHHARRVVDSATSAIQAREEDHTFRNLMTFLAGVGLGVGAGMLLAPTSGTELRSSIGGRVKDISEGVRARVSGHESATGTV